MKQIQELIAAVVVTGLVVVGMLAIGLSALANPNTVVASDAPAGPNSTDAAPVNATVDQGQISQLSSLISQYQSREKQYQSQLNTVTQQLNQATAALGQDEALIQELQRRGVIRIQSDGSVQIRRGQ